MAGKVVDLTRKAEKMTINEAKLEFLSLSCPRASEYVLRIKKIDEKEVTCQRGNSEIINEFFKILESSEIEMTKFHLLAVQPEDYLAFRKHLGKSDSYQVKWIVFNQSVNPQLVIDFSLKCPDLEFLLVRGYNQKYPCKKTDYLIRVYTTYSFDCWCYPQPCACKKVIPPVAEIVKSQIPLMCKPIEWTYQEREQLLTEKIPEDLLNVGFMHNSEFFFAETGIGRAPYSPSPKSEIFNSENLIFMDVDRSKYGVSCKMKHQNIFNQKPCPESFSVLYSDKPYWKYSNCSYVERTLRMRSLLWKSDEERDSDTNQKTLMDMPMMIIDKILDNLTFSERLPFRGSCRQLYTFPGSQKHVVDDCEIDLYGVIATIEGKRFKCDKYPRKRFLEKITKNGVLKKWYFHTNVQESNGRGKHITEIADIEPIRVESLHVFLHRDTFEDAMKVIAEKCKGTLESIVLKCYACDIDFKAGAHVEKILSARRISIFCWTSQFIMGGLEAFVEKWIASDTIDSSVLRMRNWKDHQVPIELLGEKYADRIISLSYSPSSSTIQIRCDNPKKQILIERDLMKLSAKVFTTEN